MNSLAVYVFEISALLCRRFSEMREELHDRKTKRRCLVEADLCLREEGPRWRYLGHLGKTWRNSERLGECWEIPGSLKCTPSQKDSRYLSDHVN